MTSSTFCVKLRKKIGVNHKRILDCSILLLTVAILVLVYYHTDKASIKNGLEIGSRIPDFKYSDQDGREHGFSLLNGKKVCLMFLSFECHECAKLLRNMDFLINCLDQDIDFLLMFPLSSKANILSVNNMRVRSKIYFIKRSVFAKVFNEKIVPKIYYVNENKHVVYKRQGYLEVQKEVKLLKYFIGNSLVEPMKEKLVKINGGRIEYAKIVNLQKKSNDCGLAALLNVFNLLGVADEDKKELDKIKISKKGLSMLELKEIAEKEGFQATGWKLSYKDLVKSELPLIALIFNSHYVVIERISDQEVSLIDPEIGRVVYTKQGFIRIWKGFVLKINRSNKKELETSFKIKNI